MAQHALPDPSQFDEPSSDSSQANSNEQSSAGSRRDAPGYPSENECLNYLARIPSLILTGLVTPAKANAMRANYQEILKYHRENRSRETRGGLTDEDVLDLADKSPEILNLLDGFLTPEQIALAMGQSSRKPR